MDFIEVAIEKENDGSDIRLDNMSLVATEAFIKILTALKNMVEAEALPDLKIGVKEGSACLRINDDGTDDHLHVVRENVMRVVRDDSSRTNVYVNSLKNIQEALNSDLSIDIRYGRGTKAVSVLPLFKRKFRNTRNMASVSQSYRIEFFKSKITQIGGEKRINFHIGEGGSKGVIQCSESQAQDAAKFLFKEAYFSAWAYQSRDDKSVYYCCDFYGGDSVEYFIKFQQVFKTFTTSSIDEKLEIIRINLKEYYSNQDFAGARKFIRLFDTDSVDDNFLMTILLYSKAFKENDRMSEVLNKIEERLSNSINCPVL